MNLENCIVYQDRGSAYKTDEFGKRKEFISLLNELFDFENTTISDLFNKNNQKRHVNLYVFDYSRIMRNLEFGLLFSLLCTMYDVKIHSVKEGLISVEDDMIPSVRLSKYMIAAINMFSGENYAHSISVNTKKSVNKVMGVTVGNSGGIQKKWGAKFKGLDGKSVELSPKQIVGLNRRILALIKRFNQEYKTGFYPEIVKDIERTKKVRISLSYISKVKKEALTK